MTQSFKSSPAVEAGYDPGCTCVYLRSATRRATQIYDNHLQAAGLTLNQYSLLSRLSRHSGVSVSRFAEIMSMDRTTLTRNLQSLQTAGWLTVAPAGRSRALALSVAGEAKLVESIPLWRAAQTQVNELLGAQTQRELHSALKASIRSLENRQAPGA